MTGGGGGGGGGIEFSEQGLWGSCFWSSARSATISSLTKKLLLCVYGYEGRFCF